MLLIYIYPKRRIFTYTYGHFSRKLTSAICIFHSLGFSQVINRFKMRGEMFASIVVLERDSVYVFSITEEGYLYALSLFNKTFNHTLL